MANIKVKRRPRPKAPSQSPQFNTDELALILSLVVTELDYYDEIGAEPGEEQEFLDCLRAVERKITPIIVVRSYPS